LLEIYLEGADFPLSLVKQVFTNEDGTNGILYLVSSHINISNNQLKTIYQRRWKVECYHKSLKQNVSLAKSPTQTNHFFAALCGYTKVEMLKVKTRQNHFALKTKLYLKVSAISFSNFERIEPDSILRVR